MFAAVPWSGSCTQRGSERLPVVGVNRGKSLEGSAAVGAEPDGNIGMAYAPAGKGSC